MTRLRAALYARVSTDEQALYGDSLRMQLDTLQDFAKKNNYVVVDTYIDDGYTATNLKRPSLQRLLSDVAQNEIDMVLFVKIDRWSRGVRNYYKLQDVLDENKVNWKAVLEDYDTTTTIGRLQINIMLTIAENESSVTSDRIKAVFKNKIARGEVITGTKRFGYDIVDKKLKINEVEAEKIRDIYNKYEELMSISKLVRYHNQYYGQTGYMPLKRLLTNYLYIGWHVSANYGTNKNYCESIISIDQFERVQRLIAINAKNSEKIKYKKDYIFSKILFCDVCGRRLSGNSVLKHYKSTGDTILKIYRCPKHYRDKSCSNNSSIAESKLEKYLLKNIKSELEQYSLSFEIEERKSISKPKIDINKINEKLDKLLDMYMDNKINELQYNKKYAELNAALEAAKKENERDERKPIDKQRIEQFLRMDIEAIYHTLEPLERRRLWLSIIDSIYIQKGKIKINFI